MNRPPSERVQRILDEWNSEPETTKSIDEIFDENWADTCRDYGMPVACPSRKPGSDIRCLHEAGHTGDHEGSPVGSLFVGPVSWPTPDVTSADRAATVGTEPTVPPAVRTAAALSGVDGSPGQPEAAETISDGFVSALLPPGPGAFEPDRVEYVRLTGIERAAYERGRADERVELDRLLGANLATRVAEGVRACPDAWALLPEEMRDASPNELADQVVAIIRGLAGGERPGAAGGTR